jgi:hypothetical protein
VLARSDPPGPGGGTLTSADLLAMCCLFGTNRSSRIAYWSVETSRLWHAPKHPGFGDWRAPKASCRRRAPAPSSSRWPGPRDCRAASARRMFELHLGRACAPGCRASRRGAAARSPPSSGALKSGPAPGRCSPALTAPRSRETSCLSSVSPCPPPWRSIMLPNEVSSEILGRETVRLVFVPRGRRRVSAVSVRSTVISRSCCRDTASTQNMSVRHSASCVSPSQPNSAKRARSRRSRPWVADRGWVASDEHIRGVFRERASKA